MRKIHLGSQSTKLNENISLIYFPKIYNLEKEIQELFFKMMIINFLTPNSN